MYGYQITLKTSDHFWFIMEKSWKEDMNLVINLEQLKLAQNKAWSYIKLETIENL